MNTATDGAQGRARDVAGSGPIFVVGPQRSGTTLVRLLLDSHPDVAIGPETGLMLQVEPFHAPYGTSGTAPWYASLGWERTEVEAVLGQTLDRMFARFAAEHGASRWGEKTPLHRYHIPDLARMFPQASFIAVIRHPGAVAVSRGKWGYGDLETVRDWLLTLRHLLRARGMLGADRVHVMRYEALLAEPEATVGRLCAFLGLDAHPDMLRHHVVQANRDEPAETDGGTVATAPLDSTRVDAWSRARDEEEIARIAGWTGPVLAALGYRPSSAALEGPWDERAWEVALDAVAAQLEPLIAEVRRPDASGGADTAEAGSPAEGHRPEVTHEAELRDQLGELQTLLAQREQQLGETREALARARDRLGRLQARKAVRAALKVADTLGRLRRA